MKKISILKLALLVAALLLAQHLFAITRKKRQGIVRVNNNSDFTIYYKPENGITALPILPKFASDKELDGLATHLHKNKVYKVTRGILAQVNTNGEVIPNYTYASYFERGYAFMVGGWISTPPDTGWQALFNAANSIN